MTLELKNPNRVREAREASGMTTAELARRIGATPHKLGRVERGEVLLKADDAAKIARVLNVPVAQVMGSAEADESATATPPQRFHAEALLPIYGPSRPDGAALAIGPASARGWAERPPQLLDISDAFAVWMPDGSMAPRFDPGELLFVHPHKVPAVGDDIVASILDVRGGAQGATVRRLAQRDGEAVQVARYGDAPGFDVVPRARMRVLGVVVGTKTRSG